MVRSKPKIFWKYAKTRLKTKPTIPSLVKPDGFKETTPKDKADALNNFFASVFTLEDLASIPATQTSHVDEILSSIDITPEIVYEKLQNLNPNKSPGHDKWHPYFLKNTICIPLSILFKKSLKEGAHKSWLKAIITAIYKKGIRTSGNYRPISITSVISKIMESIVRDEIVAYMMKHNLLSDDQHGFVPGRDCITQLLLCMEDWTNMMENGEAFDAIYTDFAKAFDSVAHERLLVKLENMGTRGDLLNWIESFLSGRTECVNEKGQTSSWKDVMSGVPQGSVIGPLLFVIFINDLPDEVKLNICKLFADDCKLYGAFKKDTDNKLKIDLDNMDKWSKHCQLPFDASKCKVMYFGYNNHQDTYNLCNHTLETPLGVIIDDQLRFHIHTAAASKKANQILGIIRKAYTARDASTISTLYKEMVRPHLEYGNTIWCPFYQCDIKKVESVQRRATKLIPELKNKTYEERLKHLTLPSLVYRRRRGDMIMMYKMMNGLIRMETSKLFTPTRIPHTRGHAQRVFKSHTVKSARVNFFSQRVINNWNSLPNYVVEATSMNIFKNRLDKFWDDYHYVTTD